MQRLSPIANLNPTLNFLTLGKFWLSELNVSAEIETRAGSRIFSKRGYLKNFCKL